MPTVNSSLYSCPLTLVLNLFTRQIGRMVATLGEAHDQGWRVTIYCRWGKRDGMKSIRECTARIDADLMTMLWTHGREYPLARLDGRLKCPRCGSRRVLVAFSPPENADKIRAAR